MANELESKPCFFKKQKNIHIYIYIAKVYDREPCRPQLSVKGKGSRVGSRGAECFRKERGGEAAGGRVGRGHIHTHTLTHTFTHTHTRREAEEHLLLQGLHSHFLVLQLLLHLGQLLLQPGELRTTRQSVGDTHTQTQTQTHTHTHRPEAESVKAGV